MRGGKRRTFIVYIFHAAYYFETQERKSRVLLRSSTRAEGRTVHGSPRNSAAAAALIISTSGVRSNMAACGWKY